MKEERKLITDIGDILFKDWIRCHVNAEYGLLVISGDYSEIELWFAFQNLLSQYHEVSNNKEAIGFVKRVSTMQAIDLKISQVEMLVEAISTLQNARFSASRAGFFVKLIKSFFSNTDLWSQIERLTCCLKEWGYEQAFTKESLVADLKRILVELQNDRLQLAQKKLQHENLEKKSGKGGPPTREHYYRILHCIESYKKRELDRERLNMYDFCLYIREYEEYASSHKLKTR